MSAAEGFARNPDHAPRTMLEVWGYDWDPEESHWAWGQLSELKHAPNNDGTAKSQA